MALDEDFNKANSSIRNVNDNLKDTKQYLEDVNDIGADASFSFASISNEIGKLVKGSGDYKESIEEAANVASTLLKSSRNLTKLTTDTLKDKKKAVGIDKAAKKLAGDKAALMSQMKLLQSQAAVSSGVEKENLEKAARALYNAGVSADVISEAYEDINKTNEKINKSSKFFDNLSETLRTIPGIGPAIAGPFQKAGQAAREARIKGDNMLKSFAKGGLEIAKAFSPAVILAALFEADKLTTNFARQLGVSREVAKDIKGEFINIAIESGKSYLNATDMLKAATELGEELGAVSGFTEEQVTNQTMLTKQLGLSGKEAAGIAKLSSINGKESRKVTTEILDQVVGLQKQTGIQLDGRKIVKEVASINGALGAQYGYNTKELTKAVIQANLLGIELKDAETISKGLLNFQSSIESELEAELMIGKSLNFEKARGLALQGKSAEAAAEVLGQIGSQAEFLKLNVIQREALAKATNMDVNALSDSIQKQEILKNLGAESIAQLAQTEEGKRRLIAAGGEELLQNYEQQSSAEKFNDLMVKLKEKLGDIVEGPLGSMVNGFVEFLNTAGGIKTIMIALGAIMVANFAKTIISLGTQIMLYKRLGKQKLKSAAANVVDTAAEAGKSVAKIPFVGGFLAIGLAAGIAGYLFGQLNKAKSIGDGAFGADGNTQISTREGGLFEISKNDDVVVAPGAINKMNQSEGGGDNSQLIAVVREQNNILMQILQKDTNIEIDGVILNKKVQQSLSPLG